MPPVPFLMITAELEVVRCWQDPLFPSTIVAADSNRTDV